jgi:uncharacterized membrane protein
MATVLVDLGLAAVLALNFVQGIRTGSAVMFFGNYKRSEYPLQFWIAITLSGIGAAVLLSMSVLPAL